MSKRSLESTLNDNWEDSKHMKCDISVNSCDSDEDDDRKYEIMGEDDIEGQEDGRVSLEAGVQITPFNMKEEMEEGHFDSDGMYHWRKDGKEVRDNWLENIDWIKIEKRDEDDKPNESDEKTSEGNCSQTQFDQVAIYKEMLNYMKPSESVAKALRRLGGNKRVSNCQRWKHKKAGLNGNDQSGSDVSREGVTALTELANRQLTYTGNMDVYQETYEQILSMVENDDEIKAAAESVADSDVLNIYSDDFNIKEKARFDDTRKTTGNATDSDLMWEFKWRKDSSSIEGPYTTQQMDEWARSGHFNGEVWVRKCGTSGDFYTSNRIDFELYL